MNDIVKIEGQLFRKDNLNNNLIINPEDEDFIYDLVNKIGIKSIELNITLLKHFGSKLDMFENLNFLEKIPNIESLVVVELGNNKIDLSPIQNLRFLKNLSISKGTNSALDLGNLSNLQNISITWTKRIINVNLCSELKFAKIRGLKSKNLNMLSNLHKLNHLIICDSSLHSLEGIQDLMNLQKMELIRNRSLVDINHLSSLKKLKSLSIESCNKLESVAALSKNNSIERITLINQINIRSILSLKQVKSLKVLNLLQKTKVADGDMSIFKSIDGRVATCKHYFPANIVQKLDKN